MANITYVTGNHGKYISVREVFLEKHIDIDFCNYELEEPNVNDIEIISKAKVSEAYSLLKTPCFVADSGFYIDYYPDKPGYPGSFVKRSGISSNIEELLATMKNETNRTCRFVDCLTFYDGKEYFTFFGMSKGTLSLNKRGTDLHKAKSNLWFVFIPDNCNKTLAEMSDEERKNRNDGHTSATKIFADWYKNEYLKNNMKMIKKYK